MSLKTRLLRIERILPPDAVGAAAAAPDLFARIDAWTAFYLGEGPNPTRERPLGADEEEWARRERAMEDSMERFRDVFAEAAEAEERERRNEEAAA